MIDVNTVINYIENKNNIKLFDYQKVMLQELIEGNKVYTPRCAGRSMIYKGYADFLKDVESKNNHSFDADCYGITYHDVVKNHLLTDDLINKIKFDLDKECFEAEFVGKYIE